MNDRLQSLDIMRGMTVALMILVNNGVGHDHFAQLVHSKWNGLTCCDLVFPFFLFMVGVSIHLSLGRRFSQPTDRNQKYDATRKIVVRTAKLIVIGILLHAWDMWIGGKENILSTIRVWGVLQRIALSYCIASLIVVWVRNTRIQWYVAAGSLMVYSYLLLHFNGYAEDPINIAAVIDRSLFGEAHLYHKSPIDPEGLLGTLPSIAHVLIGVAAGKIVTVPTSIDRRIRLLTLFGAVLVVCGIMMSAALPLNKRIWSPSYVTLTCGLASLLLSLLLCVVDTRKWTRWSTPFRWFGMNAIVLYVGSEMLSPMLKSAGITDSLYSIMMDSITACGMDSGVNAQIVSLMCALLMVLLVTIPAWLLYKSKIFIKI